jgi:hypothetical protein
MPNTLNVYSTLSDHLLFLLRGVLVLPKLRLVKPQHRDRIRRRRMFGSLKRGFRSLPRLTSARTKDGCRYGGIAASI